MEKPSLTLVKSNNPQKHSKELLTMFKALGHNMVCFSSEASTDPFKIGITDPKQVVGKVGSANTVYFENAEMFNPSQMERTCRDLMFYHLNEKNVIVNMREYDDNGNKIELCSTLERMASKVITIKNDR